MFNTGGGFFLFCGNARQTDCLKLLDIFFIADMEDNGNDTGKQSKGSGNVKDYAIADTGVIVLDNISVYDG